MSAIPSIELLLDELHAVGAGGAEVAVVPAVRRYLDAARTHLRERHRAGDSGLSVNELHSDMMDRLVKTLFARAEEMHLASGGEVESRASLVAVGGYARREMSIYSDVDLLLLYKGALTPYVSFVAERIQYWLWDASVSVGCATRTVPETLKMAREDASVATSILAPRYLAGDGDFFRKATDKVHRELLSEPERFIAKLVDIHRERHASYGDSLYLLQPNVKDGAGGLRDYHVAYWSMVAAQGGARRRDDFLHLGLLTADEMRELLAGLDFLWRIRNELHLLSGRRNDQMSFESQERIAEFLDPKRDPDAADLPVERFMGEYYRHARAVENYSSLVVEQCHARVRKSKPGPARDVGDGFRVVGAQLEISHSRVLREDPIRLIRVFNVAQRHDVGLSRTARRMIRENLTLIDDAYRSSPAASEAFLSILDSETRVMRTLMEMNEVGLLGRYLPEWEHIVCRWQHVMYHTYTVDVHSIFLVEELRRLWRQKYERAFPELTAIMRSAEDRPVLFLGCLLHDIGKGFGGDHSSRGAERARACVERLGLSQERVARVVFLVRQHLIMSYLAQRRDLSDPKLLLEFARVVGDRTNLRNLYLVTFADIRASSRAAWTDWKGALIRELFERTAEILESGADEPNKAMELIERRVETRRESARAELQALGVASSHIQTYFEMMPHRYFTAHTPRQIARHAMVVVSLAPNKLMATAVREMRGGFSEFILCTKDMHGLYANVSGVLTAHHFNILGAHVYTARSGLALEIYRLTTPAGAEEERGIAWTEFKESLEAVLAGSLDVKELTRRRGRTIGKKAPPTKTPPSVGISNEESDFYTIVDVAADDRLGLLYDLTSTIAQHGCEIYISKAATILDQVTDTFYLKDANGGKLREPAAIESLERALLAAVGAGRDDHES